MRSPPLGTKDDHNGVKQTNREDRCPGYPEGRGGRGMTSFLLTQVVLSEKKFAGIRRGSTSSWKSLGEKTEPEKRGFYIEMHIANGLGMELFPGRGIEGIPPLHLLSKVKIEL